MRALASQRLARAQPPPAGRHPSASTRSLLAALECEAPAKCRLVGELKRRSPSAGPLREDLEPALLARAYVGAGASAVSVLTEPSRFGGSLADLERVAAAVAVPVLRKDFLLDPRQVLESREAGADAVLLIVRMLQPALLGELMDCAADAGLEALVEVHGTDELATALAAGAKVVGVNNRDLRTLRTDVSRSLEVAAAARDEGLGWPRVAVSESGIRTRAEVLALARAGYHAVLVGETLLRAADPGAAVRRLLGAAAG